MSSRAKVAVAIAAVSLISFSAGAIGFAVGSSAVVAPASGGSQILGGPLAALKPSKAFLPAGTDSIESLAEVQFQAPCSTGSVRDVVLSGQTSIVRGAPAVNGSNHRTFSTTMQSLNLIGFDSQLGNVKVSLNPTMPTVGQVTANGLSTGPDFPATSFFDVFVEIQSNAGTLHNAQPIHMENDTIISLPPIGSEYGGGGTSVQLLDSSNAVVACVIHASHIPEDPSHILLEHQLLLLEQKLNTIAPGP